ncbi:uncharacterized protein LOC125518466 [Triticum urartu]|uniref:uncharacterized protein LOC125518466 n=1 Tax=Triticum urartu TaxID=4572 RepID=UPI002044C1D3|nr:uncharacterized protein LOC125518466 [Triticum urartu]
MVVYTARVDEDLTQTPDPDASSSQNLAATPVQLRLQSSSSRRPVADGDDDMGNGSVGFAWLLVAALLLGSCTTPACSSRLLPDGGAKVWVAGGPGYGSSGKAALVVRRSLGLRLTAPPSPTSNTPRASAAPAPPGGQV